MMPFHTKLALFLSQRCKSLERMYKCLFCVYVKELEMAIVNSATRVAERYTCALILKLNMTLCNITLTGWAN